LDDHQGLNANCGDKTVISGLRWYASDRYRLLITVGGAGGDLVKPVVVVCFGN